MVTIKEKRTLRKKLNLYEGTVEHMYLDTKGYVTVGIGHLLKDVVSAQALNFVHQADENKKAIKEEIKTDFEEVKKQTKGKLASSYKKHTKLKLKQADIDKLTNKHIETFESELKNIYGSTEFAGYPSEVRLALFDMIFNLGMSTLKNKFKNFNKHIKAKSWASAAKESNRPDVSKARNKYVKDLLDKTAKAATKP